jgi:hypothetical protein
MSFDPPTVKGAISSYRSSLYQTFAEHAQAAISVWILEQLKFQYPKHRIKGGTVDIFYSYFFDLTPTQMNSLQLPAVAIDVVLTEHPTLGAAIGSGDGGVVPGALKDVEIGIAVFAANAADAANIENVISSRLDRIINHSENTPLLFFTKYHMADDRGFRTLYSFDFPTLWQAMPDEVFIKMTYGKSSCVEEYVDDLLDDTFLGVFGSVNTEIITEGETTINNSVSHTVLSVKFTPSIP